MSESPKPISRVTDQRPNPSRRWKCGYVNSGLQCETGPTNDGKCCLVSNVDEGEYVSCGATCGGIKGCELASVCEQKDKTLRDLGPCIPQRTRWFSRQNIALNSAIFVGGILLLAMSVPQRESVFVPGGLSQKHAQILGNTLVSDRCSLCHPNSHPSEFSSMTQDELCMKCHSSHMPDASLASPHDLEPGLLTQLSTAPPADSNSILSLRHLLTSTGENVSETKCAMCHVEHHGGDRDLKAITDTRCQACHQSQFASFSHGHPEFEDYPYRAERRIAFDHSSHLGKHFAQKNEPFDCSRCHVDEAQKGNLGSVFRSVGFEKACASCHLEPIQAATTNGWAFLQTPCLDPEAVKLTEKELSDWPQNALFDFEGRVSVAMRLLLAADPECADALSQLPATHDIKDIEATKRNAASVSLAKGYRRLVRELASIGQSAIERRLTTVVVNALAREPNSHERQLIADMAAGLPPDLFRQIEQDWFGTNASIANLNSAESFQLVSSNAQLASGDDDLLVDDSNDPLLRQMGLNSRFSKPAQVDLQSPSAATPSAQRELAGDSTPPPPSGENSNLLGENLSDNNSSSLQIENNALQDAAEPDAGLLSDESLDGDLLGESDGGFEEENAAQPAGGELVYSKVSGVEHVASGGWYLDKQLLVVRYMPRGHSDPLLAAWSEFVTILNTSISRKEDQAASPPWHDPYLALGSVVPGSCSECHLLGRDSEQQTEMANWRAIAKPENLKLFTKFDHSPHLTIPTLNDCRYCHQLNTGGEMTLRTVFDQQKATKGSGNRLVSDREQVFAFLDTEFSSMRLQQCNACHREGAARDGCTQCHNYHIGKEAFEWAHRTADGRTPSGN